MKAYRPELLDVAPADRGRVAIAADPVLASLFAPFRTEAVTALPAIDAAAKNGGEAEYELFDRAYRSGHRLAGMAAVLRLPKLAHVLELLAFVLDLGRELQTFERHSLGYLVSLLKDGAGAIIDDLAGPEGASSRDVSDVVEECRTYLAGPLRDRASPPDAAPMPPQPATEGGVPSPPSHHGPVDAGGTPPDDEPEELDIPGDKVGLISDFCEEARDSLALVGRRLVEVEVASDPLPVVNEVFRGVHTIKGGARLLKVGKIERLAHAMEALLDEMRTGTCRVDAAVIDVLLNGCKLLAAMVDEVASRGPVRTRIGPAVAALARDAGGAPSIPAAAAPPALIPVSGVVAAALPAPVQAKISARRPAAGPDTIRVTTDKLDDVLNTASEVFIGRIRLKGGVDALAAAVRAFRRALQDVHGAGGLLPPDRLADVARRLHAELRTLMAQRKGGVVPQDQLAAAVNRALADLAAEAEARGAATQEELGLNLLSVENIRKRLDKDVEQLERLSGRLQSDAMRFRMVPIAHLFDRFPIQLRELARQLGKKVQVSIDGADTELDKVMANQLADPLLHILRNSLDHGLEDPATRLSLGKPEAGNISLRAFYQGSNAVIEIRDDGRGINAGRVLAKAVESGLVEADRAASLSHGEILQLIFSPGLSTASAVSTVSGRGVGMDVVMTAISQVQGSVGIESVEKVGTTISIRLPLTLAVVGILLVREGAQTFAMPIQHVEEILAVRPGDLRQVGGTTLYSHRGAALPVMALSSMLQFPPSPFAEREASMVVLADGERRVGILLDAVLGRQEVLIKNLGRLVRRAPFVIGCTILSDSRLVLILNAWELVNSPTRRLVAVAPASGRGDERRRHTVLVVDDSPMQRNHLGTVLMEAGYRAETAENGFDALQRLRNRHFSAFCVDIVMPLMDGFEFTERLRRLPSHASSPVLLITGHSTEAVAAEQQRAADLGVAGLYRKPVGTAELLAALDRLCLSPTETMVGPDVRRPVSARV